MLRKLFCNLWILWRRRERKWEEKHKIKEGKRKKGNKNFPLHSNKFIFLHVWICFISFLVFFLRLLFCFYPHVKIFFFGGACFIFCKYLSFDAYLEIYSFHIYTLFYCSPWVDGVVGKKKTFILLPFLTVLPFFKFLFYHYLCWLPRQVRKSLARKAWIRLEVTDKSFFKFALKSFFGSKTFFWKKKTIATKVF
jgi:hypothetical protein